MSVTTVLVPVLAGDVAQILSGRLPDSLLRRAAVLRPRVQRVDGIREELHALLYPLWEQGNDRRAPPSAFDPRRWLPGLRGARAPVRMPAGYDPDVQLFGRSLPAASATPAETARRISDLLALDDGAFTAAMGDDLASFDPTTRDLWTHAAQSAPPDLEAAFRAEVDAAVQALATKPPLLRGAWNAVVRLCAWSWPVWRIDGEMVNELLGTLGLTVRAEPARPLFESLTAAQPSLAAQPSFAAALGDLPDKLPSFASAGACWTAAGVKPLAGSLRLQGSRILQNASRNADDPVATLRNLRLLSEAVFYCERAELGLAEAAGVEWHERRKG